MHRCEPSCEVAVMPATAASSFFGHHRDDVLDLAPGRRRQTARKSCGPSGRSRAGRKPWCRRRETDSRRRRHTTARRYRRAVRAPRRARSRCGPAPVRCRACRPNRQKTRGSTDVSYSTLPRRAVRRDISVPLSRNAIPLFVVQDRLCSVHAEGGFCAAGRRLCAVNVKLTMRLALGAVLLGSAHSIPRPVFSRGRRGCLHGWRQTVWSSCGEGWGCNPFPCVQGQRGQREGFLRALPFSLRRARGVCALALQREAA